MAFGKLNRNSTAFLLCDMQEGFRPVSLRFAEVLVVCRKLCKAARIFKRLLVVSEQNPQVCGSTVSELMEVIKEGDNSPSSLFHYAKTTFSMVTPQLLQRLADDKISTVLLFGVETHVCVLQSALDLLQHGIKVHLVVDATSSRSQVDRHFAIARMRQAGAVITTAEAALFELCGDKDAPEFREMQPLVAAASPDSGLLPGLTDLATFELSSDLFAK